jgi:hypothetical protein
MAGSATSRLYVEGADDEHSIGHLLLRRGFVPATLPELHDSGGKTEVLKAIRVSIGAGTGSSLGFVLDANDDPAETWQSVRSRLGMVGVEAPDELPAHGFVGESEEFRTRVGVWLMPDNRRTGALEDFLRDLVTDGDPLLLHAEKSTSVAKQRGARFVAKDVKKAVLHAWLAWQQEPGRPYGAALQAHYLRDDSEAAVRFVAWFSRVFGISANRK